MVKANKPVLDILQSCSGHASHWLKDAEFESVIAVWASVFALKTRVTPDVRLVSGYPAIRPVFQVSGYPAR